MTIGDWIVFAIAAYIVTYLLAWLQEFLPPEHRIFIRSSTARKLREAKYKPLPPLRTFNSLEEVLAYDPMSGFDDSHDEDIQNDEFYYFFMDGEND